MHYQRYSRAFFLSAWTWFDFVGIGVSVVDAVVFGYALTDVDTSTGQFSVLRILRLVRFIRLVRLFKLLRELWLLVIALIVSLRIIFWALMFLVLVLYAFGIMLRGLTEGENLDPKYWSSLPVVMYSLMQICTYDAWPVVTRGITDKMPFMHAFFLIFMSCASIGILNLVVGCLVHTVFQIAELLAPAAQREAAFQKQLGLVELSGDFRKWNGRPTFKFEHRISRNEVFDVFGRIEFFFIWKAINTTTSGTSSS
jgi:hypothetical protein